MISGILLSRTVFAFLGNRPLQTAAQTAHLLCAYRGFAVLSLHLGLHRDNILNMAESLFKKNFAGYMFLQIHFVFFNLDEPLILYLLDYLAVMGAFVCVGYYLARILKYKRSEFLSSDLLFYKIRPQP